MITSKLPKLFHQKEINRKIDTETLVEPTSRPFLRFLFFKKSISYADRKENKTGILYLVVRKWKWMLSIGAGISLFTIWELKNLNPQFEVEAFNTFAVKCYCCLPLRITSRAWGWIASREVPVSLRPMLYGFYAKSFDVDLNEMKFDLTSFPSLVDFFVRPLKDDVRPIAHNCDIVSPSDGTILYFGPVTSCSVQQVKGVTYNLQHFLGDVNWSLAQEDQISKCNDADYIKTLLRNPANRLYQVTVYLAPGDYHRFHSPADWEIQLRRHFKGKLLSVNPKIAKYLPDLFSLNERVVYVGNWDRGFMAYTAVGATNVGSIKVYCDTELETNTIRWPDAKSWEDEQLGRLRMRKGELFGEFRMGSTIVLLFEAPPEFELSLEIGERIKVGQALGKCFAPNEK